MITVKQARVGADLTQQQTADALGVHVQTYARMEKHPEDMTMKEAHAFAEIVNVPIESISFLPSNSN